MSPLRIALLGGAAALAMSFGAAFAANADTVAPKAPASVEKRVIIIDDGKGDHREMRWESSGDDHHGQHMAEHLRAVLQLTSAQEPALQSFLASMKPPERAHEHGDGEHGDGEHHFERHMEIHADHDASPAEMAKVHEEMAKAHAEMAKAHEEMEKHRAEMAAMTTPQKLDLMVKRMNEHMAEATSRLQQHVAAIKTFYAALTVSQQRAFDALHDGGMMGGMHDDGPGGMDHRHMGEMDMDGMQMGMMPPPPPPLPPLPPLAMRAPPPPPAPPAPPAAPPPPPAF